MFGKEAEGPEQEDVGKTTSKKHKVGGKHKGGKKGKKKHGKKHSKKKMVAKK